VNEFGEEQSYYIWPEGHEDGQPYGDDFNQRVIDALKAAGLECENA
jgi:hypothetical protein